MKLDNIKYYTLLKDGANEEFMNFLEESLATIGTIVIGKKPIEDSLSEADMEALLLNDFKGKPLLVLTEESPDRKKVFDESFSCHTLFKNKNTGQYKAISNAKSKDYEERKSMMLDLINRRIYSYENSKPEVKIRKDIEKRKRKRQAEIERRYSEIPELTGDFQDDIKTLCEYSKNREEFKEFLRMAGGVFDMSNRNLTRLSRASICFEGESIAENCNNEDVRVYRAMPLGSIIEEGDWVTLHRDYAEDHEKSLIDEPETVVDYLDVSSNDVYSINDQNEAVYAPLDSWMGAKSLNEAWTIFSPPGKPLKFPDIKERTLSEIESSPEI